MKTLVNYIFENSSDYYVIYSSQTNNKVNDVLGCTIGMSQEEAQKLYDSIESKVQDNKDNIYLLEMVDEDDLIEKLKEAKGNLGNSPERYIDEFLSEKDFISKWNEITK